MAAASNPLKSTLQSATTLEIRCTIINQLWGLDCKGQDFEWDQKFSSFFEYYDEQCVAAAHDGKNRMLIRTHQDLIDIIQEFRKKGVTRSSIQEGLRPRLPRPEPLDKDELLCDAIDLAARIWLMTF